MTLRSTTRLDPLGYMLFGARNLESSDRGLMGDGWLPIVGRVDALDDVERLKKILDASLLRVFDGLQASLARDQRGYRPPAERDDNDEQEDDPETGILQDDAILNEQEVSDLDGLGRDVVHLLNRYSEERLQEDALRAASRPDSRTDFRIAGGPTVAGLHFGPPSGSPWGSRPTSRPGSAYGDGFRGFGAQGRGFGSVRGGGSGSGFGTPSQAMSRISSQQG